MLYGVTLARAARCFATSPAIVSDSGCVTYAALRERVDRLAAQFLSNGLKPGDRLGMLLLNCPEFIEIILACARTGIIAVPLNTRYARAEVDAVVADCEPKAIIRHSALPEPSKRARWEVVLDQEPIEGRAEELSAPFHDPDAVFGLFYTSGTTGRAKGVMLTHRNLLANTMACLPVFHMRPGSCHLHAAPMFHLADFPGMLLALASGGCQATIPRFDAEAFCSTVARRRVSVTVLIPTMINFLTLYPRLGDYDLSSLELMVYGGSPIAPEVLKRAREKFPGTKFMQGYGMTEASPILTLLLDEHHTPERMLSCGRPPFGVEVKVMRPDGETTDIGEAGEIAGRGANVMKGYWNQPEATAQAIRNGWLHTGDIGMQDEEGFFYLVDRSKDMIVTGGENVYSTEVEAALYAHPAIREAAVIGIPDPQWGELVTACVVVKDDAAVTDKDLMEFCRERLANYKIPRRVVFYSGELPKSGTGKILKRALREPFWEGRARRVG
ncbi:MAG: AMP-binding protein [Bryobacterales bacterium]|nr:AMP-binding protein [Bryobacterales bacterium]